MSVSKVSIIVTLVHYNIYENTVSRIKYNAKFQNNVFS